MKQFIYCVLVALLLGSCSKPDTSALYQELKSVDKMVFATMAITKTAKMDNSGFFGKRISVYSYDSYMRAFVDLSCLQLDDIVYDESNKTVKVTLPPVETEVTGRDMEMQCVYDNIGFMRDSLDSKERAEIKEMTNASFKAEIEENPMFQSQLTEAAKRKARKYFETIFEANGYTASINFKNSNTQSNEEDK